MKRFLACFFFALSLFAQTPPRTLGRCILAAYNGPSGLTVYIDPTTFRANTSYDAATVWVHTYDSKKHTLTKNLIGFREQGTLWGLLASYTYTKGNQLISHCDIPPYQVEWCSIVPDSIMAGVRDTAAQCIQDLQTTPPED